MENNLIKQQLLDKASADILKEGEKQREQSTETFYIQDSMMFEYEHHQPKKKESKHHNKAQIKKRKKVGKTYGKTKHKR